MEQKRIQIIGGGFSGLALAYFLVRKGFSVRLVEEKNRFGGMLQTIPTAFGMVETAANALLSNSLVEETAEEIGIELVKTLPTAKKRFIYRNNAPRRWPLSGTGTIKFLSETMPRFFLARRKFLPKAGESVRAWGYRCLGQDATDYLLVPGLSGVYAGNSDELSANLILKRFFSKSKKVRRGKLKGSVAPLEGMGEWGKKFPQWLEKRGVEFSHEIEEGLRTVVALPPHKAADFLRERAPRLASEIGKIEMLPIVTITCFLPDSQAGISGFGCLFPKSEGFRALGVLANDRIFPLRAKAGYRSETWILGGAMDRGIVGASEAELIEILQSDRERLFGYEANFENVVIHAWEAAIPHYTLALEKLDLSAEGNYIPFGTYLGDLGLGRVLLRAEELAGIL